MVQGWLGLRSQKLEAGLRALRAAPAQAELRAAAAVEKAGVPAAWAREHTALLVPLKPAAASLATALGAATPLSRGSLQAFYEALTSLLPDNVRGKKRYKLSP